MEQGPISQMHNVNGTLLKAVELTVKKKGIT